MNENDSSSVNFVDVDFVFDNEEDQFLWLFNSFPKSMGGKQPITVMTDQAASMAAAIKNVFPQARHRLCTWHIGVNAAKHLKSLRAKDDFTSNFDYVLKYTDTIKEFETHWNRMLMKYECSTNVWLNNLYSLKEMWCPAYSKDYFSGGILSSQRSEPTNKSIKRRQQATNGLCDFYKLFIIVIDEWRDREKADYESEEGNRHLGFAAVSILVHGREIYTISLSLVFEDNFIKAMACRSNTLVSEPPNYVYQVGHPNKDIDMHTVIFNENNMEVECTCKYFSEVGILCQHSLRVYHTHNVEQIPKMYIVGRWTKDVMSTRVYADAENEPIKVQASAWRFQIIRNFIGLANASQNDTATRNIVNDAYKDAKQKVVSLLGPFDDKISVKEVENMFHLNVKDPIKRRQKGNRNARLKSAYEKARNKVRGKLKSWKKTLMVEVFPNQLFLFQ